MFSMKSIVQIDSTELGARYIEFLQASDELEVRFECLQAGDVLINGLGIERKTVDDLFMTLEEGRLFKQLRKLKFSFSRQLLLIEGRGMRYHLQ
jgi:ERCC4-type nuclease